MQLRDIQASNYWGPERCGGPVPAINSGSRVSRRRTGGRSFYRRRFEQQKSRQPAHLGCLVFLETLDLPGRPIMCLDPYRPAAGQRGDYQLSGGSGKPYNIEH